jgi:hypothetical protein
MEKPNFSLISIGKKVKRVGLQRFLVSKFLFEHQKVKEADLLCLFENQLWLEGKCLKDSQFFSKFGKAIFSLSEILKKQNPEEISPKSLKRISLKLKDQVPEFLVPLRNYGQWKSKFAGCFSLNPILSKETRDFYATKPPKNRQIGVGYRDKGSKRDLARDGSPDWAEISNDMAFQEKRIEYEVEKCNTVNEIAHLFYREGLLTEKQLKESVLGNGAHPEDPETATGEKRP